MKKHNFAFIDIETTGLNLIKHEIIEIGVVVTTPTLEIIEEFEFKIKPEHIESADPIALKVNHYDSVKWESAKNLKEVIKIISEKTKDCIMVGQNVSFDSSFLEYVFTKTGIANMMHYHKLDTISIAWAKLNKESDLKHLSLRELCLRFGIKNENAHTGLGDARATYQLYKKVNGIISLIYEKKKSLIFVGMSGGVDSAVSAALLKKDGYEVVGVFIRTWHPDFIECNEEEELHDAMRVAAHLDIPFLTFDFEDVYKKEVADYMIYEYKAGRTPNPDVMCNKEVKFGAFLKKALEMGADFVATGHYAKKYIEVSSTPEETSMYLKKGIDPSKDQSYFLWTLKQEQLKHTLFPIGHLKKIEVRKLAKKFNLPVATKKDSQGICFLGAIDLKEFLKHYIKEKRGKVLNEAGDEIGYHDGVVFHTLGERHGFTITKKNPNEGAYYVIDKDIKRNILIVSQTYATENLSKNSIQLTNTNWINETLDESKIYKAQIRYHGEFLLCKIVRQDLTTAQAIFDKPVMVASGQSCVFYDDDICLGGGVVK